MYLLSKMRIYTVEATASSIIQHDIAVFVVLPN